MFEVTGYLVLCLLAVEGATTAQSKSHEVLNDTCCHRSRKNDASLYEVSDDQRHGIFTRDDNQIDSHLTAVANNSSVDNATTCPTWFYPRTLSNGSIVCECGSNLGETISCNGTSHVVAMVACYSMTYNNDKNSLVVGASYYGCYHTSNNMINGPRRELPLHPSSLNKRCEIYNRDGQLCGQCRKGFSPLVFSYDMSCMNCTSSANNCLKYITTAFLPLTVFFVIVITFRIRVTSALMNTIVLMSQTATAPIVMRVTNNSPFEKNGLSKRIAASSFSIWNLDFFRLLYSPFCLHPKMTMVQVLALDYAIAVYPLLLIVMTYLFVELHDHGFRVVVWLWKPFHRCFVSFRRGWNIKTSLIDAFATFLLLSYVKFLSVSFDLLVPTRVYNIHGKSLTKLYLYYDGSLEYFGKEHLPYGILALAVLLVFNILPLLLLCVYPCRCFQRCLNRYRLRYQPLHTFMDAFQGHYKDGTNGTRDCRWFSALYLVVRLSYLLTMSIVPNFKFWLPIGASITLLLLLLTAILRPYKSTVYNNLDIFLLVLYMFPFVGNMTQVMSFALLQFMKIANFILGMSLIILWTYMVAILLYKLLSSIRCVRVTCQRIKASISYCREEGEPNVEEALPYRMINAGEYDPLLGMAPSVKETH